MGSIGKYAPTKKVREPQEAPAEAPPVVTPEREPVPA